MTTSAQIPVDRRADRRGRQQISGPGPARPDPGLETRSARARRAVQGNPLLMFALNNGVVVVLLIELAYFSIALGGRFFRPQVLRLILLNASMVGVLMPFYTCAQIGGSIDLGVAPIGALGSVVAGLFFTVMGFPLLAAVAMSLLMAVLIGLVYSWVVLKVGAPAIIASLAVGAFATGIGRLITQTWGTSYYQIAFDAPAAKKLIEQGFLEIPLTVWVMFLLYAIYYVLLSHTRLGAHICAVGGNPQAARLAGIRTSATTVFCLIGNCIGTVLASFFLCLRMAWVGDTGAFSVAGAGVGGALAVPITLIATTISGVRLQGGQGNIWKTVLGVIFFSALTIGMGLVNTPFQYRVIAYGLAVVFAVVLDSIRAHLRLD